MSTNGIVNSVHQNPDTQWAALEGAAAQGSTLDIWGFFKRRKSFVIVFAVVGAGLGYLLYNQKTPQGLQARQCVAFIRRFQNIRTGDDIRCIFQHVFTQ